MVTFYFEATGGAAVPSNDENEGKIESGNALYLKDFLNTEHDAVNCKDYFGKSR